MDEENVSVDLTLRGSNNRMERDANISPIVDDAEERLAQNRRQALRQTLQEALNAQPGELTRRDFNRVVNPANPAEMVREYPAPVWLTEEQIKYNLKDSFRNRLESLIFVVHPNASFNEIRPLLNEFDQQFEVVAKSIVKRLLNMEIEINGRKRKVILGDDQPRPERRSQTIGSTDATVSFSSYASVATAENTRS